MNILRLSWNVIRIVDFDTGTTLNISFDTTAKKENKKAEAHKITTCNLVDRLSQLYLQ